MNSNKNGGFTLVEAILVLFIVMLISSSTVMVATAQIERREEKNFFRQFHLDYNQMQAVAVAESKYIYMDFSQNGKKYVVKHQNQVFLERELPSHINLSADSYIRGIGYHPNGSVSQFGSLLFNIGEKRKKITVNIGQGKLLYEE